MKITSYLGFAAGVFFTAAVVLSSGCQPATSKNKEAASGQHMQTIGEKKGKRKVVQRDGKYYEVWEEHERLCSDCDR